MENRIVNWANWNKVRYTIYAPFYDAVEKFVGKGRRQAIRLVAPKPGENILIVGCGTGLDLDYMSPSCTTITAIDLTESMVEKSKIRAKNKGINAKCLTMNAENLDFDDNEFDCVLLHLILAVIPDPIACIRESARVLKKDGRISIFDKFLKQNESPSLPRRFLNIGTNILFSDINRELAQILTAANLHHVKNEPSLFGGNFITAIAQKDI